MKISKYKNHILTFALMVLLSNLILILTLVSFERIVYLIFFYHVSSAWLSYISFSFSLLFHIIYLKNRKIKWSYLGRSSVIIGVFFAGYTLLTGSLWFNATSGGYNNVFWQWNDPRQTSTLALFISYISFIIFGNMVEETEKRAKLTAILGIALFVTVPLSYFSSIIFASLHPQINPIPDQPGFIYWDPFKIFSLIFNLIGITLLFIYLIIQLTKVDQSKEKLNKIIQRKLEGE